MFNQAEKIDFKQTVDFIKSVFKTDEYLPLHPPCFDDKEKEMVCECID